MKTNLEIKRPFLSIITRSYKRPTELQRCINSVISQTVPDFEHLIINDEVGEGLHWANRQIVECATKVRGGYIYILDDDDYIISPYFIKELKILLENLYPSRPDLIICCGILNEEFFPKIWKKPVERGKIAAPNLITKRSVFEQYAQNWDQPKAGDFKFVEAIFKSDPKIYWWDYNVFRASSSCGFTEKEKKKYGIT
jgi:glycosyltransferase involved in cell wall biosynthesis